MGPPRSTRPTAAGIATKAAIRSANSRVARRPGSSPRAAWADMLGSAAVASAMPKIAERELHHAVGIVEIRDGARRQQRGEQVFTTTVICTAASANTAGQRRWAIWATAGWRHSADGGQRHPEPPQLRELDEELSETAHQHAHRQRP